MGSVQPSAGIVIRLLVAGLAAVMLAATGCGSGSEPTAQAPVAVPAGEPAVAATVPAGSLDDVRRRLEARGYAVEYGFPSGQEADAIQVTDSPGVEISGFEDPAAANTAFLAARRLLQFNSGHGLVELHAATRLYLTSSPRLLSRQDRTHFHAVVAAGEGST